MWRGIVKDMYELNKDFKERKAYMRFITGTQLLNEHNMIHSGVE